MKKCMFALVVVAFLVISAGLAMAAVATVTAEDGKQYLVRTDDKGNIVSVVDLAEGTTLSGPAAQQALANAGINLNIGPDGQIVGIKGGSYVAGGSGATSSGKRGFSGFGSRGNFGGLNYGSDSLGGTPSGSTQGTGGS